MQAQKQPPFLSLLLRLALAAAALRGFPALRASPEVAALSIGGSFCSRSGSLPSTRTQPGLAMTGFLFALEGAARAFGTCAAQSTVSAAQKIPALPGGDPALNDQGLFGGAIASVGDVDGDSVNDICVGAYLDDDGCTHCGAVYVLFLSPDGTVRASQKISSTQGGLTASGVSLVVDDLFGSSVASVGDFDGDSVTDICVGARLDNDGGSSAGAVYMLFLNINGAVKASQKISNTAGGLSATGVSLDDVDEFGVSVASAGDLDGDSVTDICVGAYRDDDGGTDHGAVHILFMNINGTVKASQKISSLQGGLSASGVSLDDEDWFGASVALSDFDGDAVTDICAGAAQDGDGGSSGQNSNVGAVYILFLESITGIVKAAQKISNMAGGLSASGVSLRDDDRFGFSVASVGDFDGDTVTDICVGAFTDDDGGTDRGAVYLLFLNTNSTVKAAQKISSLQGGLTASGVTLGDYDYFGSSIAAAGDYDGDSVTDICVGAIGDDDGGTGACLTNTPPICERGTVYMLFLRTLAHSTTNGQATTASLPLSTSSIPTSATTTAGTSTSSIPTSAASTTATTTGIRATTEASSLTVTSTSSAGNVLTSSKSSSDVTVIALAVVGAFCGLAVVVIALVFTIRSNQGRASNSSSTDEAVALTEIMSDKNYSPLEIDGGSGRNTAITGSSHQSVDLPTLTSPDALDERFVIEWEFLRLDDELAAGNFGKVIRGEYQNNDCVIKQLHDQSQAAQAELLREASQLASLKPHASLCQFFGACIDPSKPLAIVTEFIEGGNLQTWLLDKNRLVCGVDVLSLGKDLAAGIDALHRSSTLHLDIAARNLLVISQTSPMKLRICDFGLSQTIPKGCEEVSAAGCVLPWRWTDPAVLEHNSFRKESDVWSFGVTLWEIMARSRPYDEIQNARDVVPFVQEGGRLMQPSQNSGVHMSAALRVGLYEDVLLKCWDSELGRRPSISDIAKEFSTLLKRHTAEFDSQNTYSPDELATAAARSRSSTASLAVAAYGTMYDRVGSGTTQEYGSLLTNNESESSSDKSSPDKSAGGQYSTTVSLP